VSSVTQNTGVYIIPTHFRDLFHGRDKARELPEVASAIRLRKGGFLVTQKSPICIYGVEDIDISPFQWTRGRNNRSGGRQTLVQVGTGMVIAVCFDTDSRGETEGDGNGGGGPRGLHGAASKRIRQRRSPAGTHR